MKNLPIVSVSLITYNHEDYIREALNGVLMQKTDFKYELIIGEDNSTDNTRLICEEYANRYPEIIKLLPLEKKLGIKRNFIRTQSACAGKYIALLDGDDYWTDSYKLQKQADFLEKNKNYVIYFNPVKIKQRDKITNSFMYITHKIPETTSIYDLAKKGNYIYLLSAMYRRFNMQNYPENYPVGDYSLFLFIAKDGLIKKGKDVCGVFRVHEGGAWTSVNKIDKCSRMTEYFENLANYFSYDPMIKQSLYVHKLRFKYQKLLILGRTKEAKKYILESIKLNPINFKNYIFLFFIFLPRNSYSHLLEIKKKIRF